MNSTWFFQKSLVHYFTVKSFFIAIFCGAACVTTQAQTTIAEDNFNYSGGSSLNGQAGGTGWSSAWINDYTSGASLRVNTTGLSYPGLPAGGSAVWGSGGNGISEDSRSLPLQDSGLVYLQFLGQFGATSGGGTPNIRLLDDGSLTGGIGANGGSSGSVISILDNSLQPASGGSSSSTAKLSDLNLVVTLIDYQNKTTEMWLNPDLSTFDYENPSSPDAVFANLAPVFNNVAIYSRSPVAVSNLQIMSVPEPLSVSLLGLGFALFPFIRQRRK